MMIKKVFIAWFSLIAMNSFSQSQNALPGPKLIVGLVVDQMRWDFLYRYYDMYSANGFKRLLNEGFSCENTFIPYVPTVTGAGHACIYTGSVPAINGIAGNAWFDKSTNKTVYCTDDSTVSAVGAGAAWGKNSPRNLLSTTIGDELRLSNNFKSRVFGVSFKDRASILPAGHSGNAAYWYDDSGKWITSTYYMNALPAWLQKMNDEKRPDTYMSKDWNTLLPINKYDLSTADSNRYEGRISGENSITFPHKLSQVGTARKYVAFRTTPFANTFTFDLAKAVVENEKLGGNGVPDLLTINIAATDLVGHTFGPNSIEIQDTYLRLDKDLAEFLQFLDGKLGKGNYLLFLSADHGVAHVPAFLQDNKIPSGLGSQSAITRELNQVLEKKFSIKNLVLSTQNSQVYLNTEETGKQGILPAVKQSVIDYLMQQPFIAQAFELDKISAASIPEPIKEMLINGYNAKRSGDIGFIFQPAYFDGGRTGTTHGSWNPYDSHIPLVWFGWNIKQGTTNRETYMTDIAPTIAAMLRIQMPNGCVGIVIDEVIKKK